MSVLANVEEIHSNIRQACEKVNRNVEDITVIAVTKYVTIKRAEEVIEAGVHHLGENRLEGLLDKYATIKNQVNWHFIGSLQSRKVKDLIDKVDFVHSLDRKSLAKEINKRANRTIPCFVQVNISGEETKHGLDPKDVPDFIDELVNYSNVKVVGLMAMAPHVDDEQMIRDNFKRLRVLRDEIMNKWLKHAPCSYLSMGMSNDYVIAIEEGATHIRVGSRLVGSSD
ncbi:YggS family pyridoxal phosphate-dependent enzyme [Aquibacillus halophilus]|uniref:Pyridoxal phosphate homeostasis protein n=1 Tax=Aquibacillus halophilus TaxID=930132 RepID=A0A6A8D9B6_9BACI|nr:YggS family pyridoxal phosphate-dependent enzyme [Aquibacillus halophilus]MRH42178.1 YggS family pyridoxal phosphate-dependent enzyme [Aquibacillus halophilus]